MIRCGQLIMEVAPGGSIDPKLLVDCPDVRAIGHNDSALSVTNIKAGAKTTTVRSFTGNTGSMTIVNGNYSIDFNLNAGSVLDARIVNTKLNQTLTSRSFNLSGGSAESLFNAVKEAIAASHNVTIVFNPSTKTFKVAVDAYSVTFDMS